MRFSEIALGFAKGVVTLQGFFEREVEGFEDGRSAHFDEPLEL